MAKRSIFWKICLSFWITILVAMTIQAFLNRMENWRPLYKVRERVAASLDSSVGMYGKAALAYQEAGKTKALGELSEEFRNESGVDAYLIDERGNSLNPTPAPQEVRGIAAQALQSGKRERLRVRGKDLVALPISSPEGKHYVVAGSYDHRRLMSGLVNNRRLTLRLCVLLLLSGLVSFLLTRYLVAPLLALSAATRRFAEGDLSVRIGVMSDGRNDETTELARDFDVMADRIESLVKLQRQLVGDISHELRSPLARLNVALDLAREKIGGEADHALDRIEEEAQELNEMIGELLTLTRLEGGSRHIQMAPVNLTTLLREISEDGDFEAQGSGRGVKLIECDQCSINGNSELLGRAFENVIRNAIRHTDEHTDVEVSLRQERETIRITVRDHGPGVAESELGNIFLPFYRASQSRERQTGGTGLGLAICQRAVELHEGTIAAVNAPGGGLMVTFLFPAKP